MYWKAVWLLLRIRGRLTSRTFARSSATLAGVLLFTAVFGPAAFAAGHVCETRLNTLPSGSHASFLWSVLLALQVIWLLLLLAEGVGGIGSRLAPDVLRTYPLPPRAFVTASALGSLADIPTLLALPVLWGVYRSLSHNSVEHWAMLPPLGLLALNVPMMEQAALRGGARIRRYHPLLPVLFFGGIGLALAFAAGWAVLAIESLRNAHPIPALFATGVLLGQGTLTLFLADRWLAGPEDSVQRSATRPRRIRPIAPELRHPEWSRMLVAAAVEWRNLLRNLSAHLPLRLPAQMVLGIFFGWITPNLGNDALLNARDLCEMGSLLYFLVWQIQFMTNRLGNEAGTAALLLGFPFSRQQLLLVRNATLLTLLIPLDCGLASVVCLLLHAPGAIPSVLWGTLVILVLTTAVGNVISVLYPYPIPRRTEGFFAEPDRSLLFLYILLGVGIGGIFWSDSLLPGVLGIPLLLLFTALVYMLSIRIGGKLLLTRETTVIARLDGD